MFDKETPRHRLLETVRLFALDELAAAAEFDRFPHAHTACCVGKWRRAAQSSTHSMHLVPEVANLRAGAGWLESPQRDVQIVVLLAPAAGVG